MFFLLDSIDNFGEKELGFFLPYLSAQRRAKAEAFRFLPDKISSSCAFLLLRILLKEEYGIDDECLMGFLPKGKPRLLARADIGFSLSHDRKGVGVCVSSEEVGADVQDLFHYEKALAERILSPRESAVFRSGLSDDRLFTRIWTMKESFGKKTGEGVFSVLDKTDFSGAKEGNSVIDGLHYLTGQKGDLMFSVCSETPQTAFFLPPEDFLKKVEKLKKIQI